MKPKFLLTIVALNTLFLAGSIATAISVQAEDSLPKLSQTISKLVGLDSKYYPLVTSAVDRAVASKRAINSAQKKEIKPPNLPARVTAGLIPVEMRGKPQVDRQPNEQNNNAQPNTSTKNNNKDTVDRK
jgi:hypothetical protein